VIVNLQPMISHLIGEDVELVYRLAESLNSVKVDPGNLEQVILNLVINARDAMPEGGRLLVRTEERVIPDGVEVPVSGMRTGRFVCLNIQDTGQGMDAATLLPSRNSSMAALRSSSTRFRTK